MTYKAVYLTYKTVKLFSNINYYLRLLHFHIDRRAGGEVGAWGSTYTGAMEMLR